MPWMHVHLSSQAFLGGKLSLDSRVRKRVAHGCWVHGACFHTAEHVPMLQGSNIPKACHALVGLRTIHEADLS